MRTSLLDNVVCASCGRSRDAAAGKDCEDKDWHLDLSGIPDPDVTAEDGDDLAPETEDDLLAAVGPEPGKTWAELYARAALSLSYTQAQLRGARGELDRLREGGSLAAASVTGEAAMVLAVLLQRGDGEATVQREELERVQGCRIRAWVVPATGEVRLAVER